ncbi:hypothetical protein [Bacillus sonorensis]|uniref:hypothetical protein n=1 Tax=Bacillus sonorensis TaxID=119858 RepID=UPI0015C3670A|nr:hypothetical protein [Bacillus sonorensis]
MNGWIKLHRKLEDHWLFPSNEKNRAFTKFEAWIDILMMVNHADNKVLMDGNLVEVKRGQRITSIRKLADRWKWSRTKVEKFLELLEKDNMILLEKKAGKNTIIEVLNYEKYQGFDENASEEESQKKSHSKASEKPVKSLNKNEKNEKNEKKNNKRLVFDESHMKLAALLWKCIQAHSPNLKKPNLDKWANTFRLMMERDGREGKEIQDMIVWSTNHHFWYQNILSPDKLRKQYDRLAVQKNEEERKEWRNGSQQYGQSFGGNNEEASGKVSPIFGNRVGRLRKKG